MANAPITIGPFTNVPAPGSPIRSDWTQQITQFVVDRFPTSLLMKQGQGTYGTNVNADAIITFPAPFPASIAGFVVVDATTAGALLDTALICKVASLSMTAAVVRVFLHDGTKVISNGQITLSWLAFGR
jgi:hypothetical protein